MTNPGAGVGQNETATGNGLFHIAIYHNMIQ